ncbi:MAG: FHA domain-containing protein [Planctomycetaceae bacterium]|nr:FHA domain-containing protein [Planctomycetaceae bacterium]
MALVTFQVIEGLERGRIYWELPTPFTIGREDDNSIQLNDERVSRFHTKVQEDGDRLILTDLDSTNGTRVNGHPVQMRVLQIGDQVSIGRCLLVFGSPDEIKIDQRSSGRISKSDSASDADEYNHTEIGSSGSGLDLVDPATADPSDDLEDLFPNGPPEFPTELRPVQQAQLSDILAYVHDRIRFVLEEAQEATEEDNCRPMVVSRENWHRLLQLEMELAVYLRKAADPDA